MLNKFDCFIPLLDEFFYFYEKVILNLHTGPIIEQIVKKKKLKNFN